MALAPAALDEWKAAFRASVEDFKDFDGTSTHEESVNRLRKIVQSGLLKATDIRDRPEVFLAAHEIMAEFATGMGPGFWIRFMVQFNLFAGTVMAVGSPEQVARLDKIHAEGKIGCFGLTEVFAGVNSGLVVQTTATWNPEKQMFLVHCPDAGAQKNWISQGCESDFCALVADLRVGGKSVGPHAFLMEMRKDGRPVEGMHLQDMGRKTVGNDLDNARINFQNVWLPKETLLSRYGSIEKDQYVPAQKGIRPMDIIGQRLYTGRMVVARAALTFARMLYASTRRYTDNKNCWAPKGAGQKLSELSQLATLFEEAASELGRIERFCDVIDSQLSACLRKETIPNVELIEGVAAAKVKAVETAIAYCWRLKQEVGSYALMGGCGFEQMDFLQACKFAEGDSRILMQKCARDRLKAFQKGFEGPPAEASLCKEIFELGKQGKFQAEHLKMYDLAEATIARTVESFVPTARL